MTNTEKNIVYVAVGAIAMFILYKLFKGKNPLLEDTTLRTPDDKAVALIPKEVSDEAFDKVKTLLEAKRVKYEKLWKESGSKLPFKDWYIANAE
jgi:hypothetical protein